MSERNADLPWSQEAEQSVLGALLLDNAAVERVAAIVAEGDFYAQAHRAIWRSMLAIIGRGQPADVITVHEDGGHDLRYLHDLRTGVVSSTNAHRYAAIVRERSVCG